MPVDKSDAADARRFRWLLDGNGYFMEESGAETFFLTAAVEAGFQLPDYFVQRIARSRPRGRLERPTELFSEHDESQSRKKNGSFNRTENTIVQRDPVADLLRMFDPSLMNDKEKDALLTLMHFKARH